MAHYGSTGNSDNSTYLSTFLSGKSGFWVAELLDSDGKAPTGKIVGCVGLGASHSQFLVSCLRF